MRNSRKITTVLQDISKALTAYASNDDEPGLLTGYGGTILFYAYFYRLTGKRKHLDTVYRLTEKIISDLSERELSHSYCSGIAGIAWCIRHLSEHGFIDNDETEGMFDEVDAFLFDAMRHDLNQGHYDFMHMGLGVALYFLGNLPDPSAHKYLEFAVGQLENIAVTLDTGISWPDKISEEMDPRQPTAVFNLGMAHGVPAILSILGLVHENGIAIDKTQPLLTKGIEWLLAVKSPVHNSVTSLFPKKVDAGNNPTEGANSRLGWCYGDLGIATSLWNTGNRAGNKNWQQLALQIFEHTLQHRNIENGNVVDSCLCHGSMGVSHIYRRLYLSTGEKMFLNGAEHWLAQTLEMAFWPDGPAGFKYKSNKGYTNNYSLLEGIAGIGLGLLAAMDDKTVPAWDRCLLIS